MDRLEGVRLYANIGEVLDFTDWQDSDWQGGLDLHPDLIALLEGMEDDTEH
ncbi:hypothetical protein [Parasphingorhabdus flavimaris]|uniref:hypothetical protein n=1 Tax=Parasphingorhabdus flavimaris TaxID=266812 RepID=UPI003001ED3A